MLGPQFTQLSLFGDVPAAPHPEAPQRTTRRVPPDEATLPMFMEADRLQNDYIDTSHEAEEAGEYMGDMWDRKEAASRMAPIDQRPSEDFTEMRNFPHGSGLYESIRTRGYNWSRPVSVHHSYRSDERIMGQGHHRLAAAAAIERETGKPVFVPITHEEWY